MINSGKQQNENEGLTKDDVTFYHAMIHGVQLVHTNSTCVFAGLTYCIFGSVLAFLYENVSVRPSVHRSVRHTRIEFLRKEISGPN